MGAVARPGLLAFIHGDQGAGPPELGAGVPLQGLTTWVSVLHPQSMLEQLLIHQPTDPLQFMIEHLHRNNDCGEHAGPLPAPPHPQQLGAALSSEQEVGGALDHWGWW